MEKAIAVVLASLAIFTSAWGQSGLPPMQIGDMSNADGSPVPGHLPDGDHSLGTSFDVRPMRKDGQMLGVRWQDPNYDREMTQRLVDTLLNTGGVTRVIFSDPQIRGITRYRGFDDHLHVTVDPNYRR